MPSDFKKIEMYILMVIGNRPLKLEKFNENEFKKIKMP